MNLLKWAFIVIQLSCRFYTISPTNRFEGLYKKVPSVYPDTINSYCLLNQENVGTSKWNCLTLCSQIENCRLACLDGNICYMYSAYTSPYWNASSTSGTLSFNGPCYSSWYFNTDLTTQISSISTLSLWNVNSAFYAGEHSLDGYYCSCKVDPHFTTGYVGSDSTPLMGWMEVDFGSIKKVSQVLIVMRDEYSMTFFNGIEVRVGNVSGATTKNFSGNALLGTYLQSQTAPTLVIITFQEHSPLYGRYVSICNTLNTYLVLPEIKIIG